jgi:hypothetical protein
VKGKDWQTFMFDPAGRYVERLARLAERRFPDPTVSGAAYNYAFEKISDDDWRLLDGFTGRAQPGTYLMAVFSRLLEDYSRARFGRPRPPAWLKRMGELWRRVYQMLCLERMLPESIVDTLTARREREPVEIRRVIGVVRTRVSNCGQSPREINVEDPPEHSGSDTGPESEISQQELRELLLVLRSAFVSASTSSSDANTEAALASVSPGLAKLPGLLDLDDEERLILKLIYQDERSVKAAAQVLRLPEHVVRRKHDRVVLRLREVLREAGVGPELIG